MSRPLPKSTSLGATRYLPATKWKGCIDGRGQRNCERGAGFARDGGLHRAAQEGLLDQCHDQSRSDADECELEQAGKPELNARLELAQAEQQHRARPASSMSSAPSSNATATSRANVPAGRPKPRLCRSATLRWRATNTKPTSRISMPTRLATRENFGLSSSGETSSQAGITEQGDAGKTKRDQAEEDREAAHYELTCCAQRGRGQDHRLVARALQQFQQAIPADEVQGAHHHEIVAIVVEQRLDLGQPLAVARA